MAHSHSVHFPMLPMTTVTMYKRAPGNPCEGGTGNGLCCGDGGDVCWGLNEVIAKHRHCLLRARLVVDLFPQAVGRPRDR